MWAQIQQRAPNAAALAQDVSTAYRYSQNIGKAYGAYKVGSMAYRYGKRKFSKKRRRGSATGKRRYAGYRSNAAAGYNRIVSRRRGGPMRRRGKLRQGTRVRKQALGLFEGKRYTTVISFTAVAVNSPQRHRPMTEMLTAQTLASGQSLGTPTINTKLRNGMKIFVRGIRTTLHIRNNDTANPVDVRIICGWRTKAAQGTEMTNAPDWIFRKRGNTKEPIDLVDTTEYLNMPNATMNAPLAKSAYFVCHKDMVVRLGYSGGVGSDDNGSHFKLVNIWWDLHNKKNTLEADDILPVSGDAEKFMDWFPCIYVYHTDPSNVIPSASVTYKFLSTVYWKDPLG